MKITFHGAAQTVTGSKHLLEFDNGKKILLDCGMFQGMGLQTIDLNQNFGFDPQEIDAVILSHAHIDHSGLLPRLVHMGFRGPIYCTEATAAFAEVLLADSAYIQEMDVKHINKRKNRQGKPPVEALYNTQDAEKVFPLFVVKDYNQWYEIFDNIKIQFKEAGHILGSAIIQIKFIEDENEKILTFSGDIGRFNDDILQKPDTFDQSDYIIMESTYGDKLHGAFVDTVENIYNNIIETCIQKGGKLIIPAFSVGRTQEILYTLNRLELENRLPKVKYFLDSPMSIEITELTKKFPKLFNQNVQRILEIDEDPFNFKGLVYIENVEQSKKINALKEPCVIISASGMAEAGRVKHHIANSIEDPKNTILIVGYCEPQSLGGRLTAGAKEVGIFGEKYEVNADVVVIATLSAHADYSDLLKWLSCQDKEKINKIFLVHGEVEVQHLFKKRLEERGYKHIIIPSLHETIAIH